MRYARPLRFLMAIVIFAIAGSLLRDYVTDDTFIHLRYATNLVERGEFSFNPGEHTYGATSMIWVLGLAFLLKVGLPPLFAAWVFGALCGLGVILMADAIIDRLTFTDRWKTLVMIVLVSDVWFLRWTFSGMETPLATFMLLLAIWPLFADRNLAWLKTDTKLWPRYLAWGVAAGLAGLVRPEFLLVVPAALPVLLYFEYFRAGSVAGKSGRVRARPHGPLLAAASGWLAVVLPWFIYAQVTFGRITPGTASAKSGGLSFSPADMVPHLFNSLKFLAVTQGLLWVGMFLLVVLVLMRHQVREAEQSYSAPVADDPAKDSVGGAWSVWGPVALVGIAFVWTATLLGGLAVKQVWVISRYVSPLGPVLILAMSVVVEWLMSSPEIRRKNRMAGRWILITTAVATLVGNGWVFFDRVVPHARDFSTDVQSCYLEMGTRLEATTPPGAVVAALDIGAIGFASDRQVIDLMGLVSPEVLEMGRTMGFEEMVESGAWVKLLAATDAPEGHRYFVDRTEDGPRWEGRVVEGFRFELMESCILRGVGLREPQPWTVTLYRLVSIDTGVRSSAGG
jgi:hypothetical protein